MNYTTSALGRKVSKKYQLQINADFRNLLLLNLLL